LLLSCINVFMPDPLSFYYTSELDTIRFATAMLIVAFAVYILLMFLIHRDIAANPGKAEIGARRWLMYLTIFLAAIMIIVDVITLLNNFLNGELSTRFFLKVLVVLVVASAVFGYYLMDIRASGGIGKSKNRFVAIGASCAVVLSIVVSFLVAGSPWYQRNVRFDERRVSDLQTIQNETVNYWAQKNVLPAELNDLVDSISGFQPAVDPETGVAYEYSVTGELSFSLCANFATKTPEILQNVPGTTAPVRYPGDVYQQNWSHDVGRTCFDRTIDPELYKNVDSKLLLQ
jgi:hypothetical protein